MMQLVAEIRPHAAFVSGTAIGVRARARGRNRLRRKTFACRIFRPIAKSLTNLINNGEGFVPAFYPSLILVKTPSQHFLRPVQLSTPQKE